MLYSHKHNVCGNINVYSNHDLNSIVKKLKEDYDFKGEKEHKTKLKILDLETGKSLSFIINREIQKRLHMDYFKNELKNNKDLFVNFDNQTKYNIIVKNNESLKNDTKSSVFFSKKNTKEVFEEIKKTITKQIERENKSIIFDQVKTRKSSHHVVLQVVTTSQEIFVPSRSFSFKLHNYSSEEIIKIIRKNKNFTCRRKINEKKQRRNNRN